ncbi:MAG TPA: hypothetical protein VFE79_24490 [Paraburkholderia sp.]|jgi:hypothetical protein|nr:hypothetical protein [Paraburkholderia sp.]
MTAGSKIISDRRSREPAGGNAIAVCPAKIETPPRANINLSLAPLELCCGASPTALPLTTGFHALSAFPCFHPLAPAPRNRLRARGSRAATGRPAHANAPVAAVAFCTSASFASSASSAYRRPAPDLT